MQRFLAGLYGRLVLVVLAIAFFIPSDQATTVTAASGPPVVLTGHVLSRLAKSARVGDVPSDQTLALTIGLRPQSPDAIENALRRLRATSPTAFLSSNDVALTIGQPQSTIDTLSQYFSGYGMSVDSPSRDHLSIQVTGTYAQIQRALGVHLGTYRDPSGHEFYATSDDPRLPSGLASVVQAIFGLDNYPALRRLNVQNTPSPGSYVPADLRTAYNVNPLLAAGLNGTGQTIGIIGCDSFLGSDIQNFQNLYGLPHTSVTQVNSPDGGPDGTDAETTLDLEWSQAIAPNAALRYYGSPTYHNLGCTLSGVYDDVSLAVSDNIASVISISLGLCESDYNQGPNPPFLLAMETLFAAAAAHGQSVFVSSGDSGAFSCQNGQAPGVSYPASSAFVTAVGGTSLNLNQNSTYDSEAAWGSGSSCAPCGSGGGTSGAITEPSWQTNAIVPLPSTGGMRGVPDIALDSDPDTGYIIFDTIPGSGCSGVCNGFGGTSIASPQWAGIAAIANQYACHRLGQLAPRLYSPTILSARQSSTPVYHDVIAGDSGNPQFYPAQPNWDFATGWGSPNAYNLVHTLTSGIPQQLTPRVVLPFVVKSNNGC